MKNIIIAIVVLVFIGGGLFFYSKDISDWETYTNSEFNFSFQYPNSLSLSEFSAAGELLGGFSLDDNSNKIRPIVVFIMTKAEAAQVQSTAPKFCDVENTTEIYSGISSQVYDINCPGMVDSPPHMIDIHIPLNDEVTLLYRGFDYEGSGKTLIDKVVSTFSSLEGSTSK